MEPTAQGICLICAHNSYCSIKKNSFILHCSEYAAKAPEWTEEENLPVDRQGASGGLCAYCYYADDCSLNLEDQVIFTCEYFH